MAKKAEEKEQIDKWEVEGAVRTLEEYQRIMKDKELKEKAVAKLKEKAEEYSKLSKEFD